MQLKPSSVIDFADSLLFMMVIPSLVDVYLQMPMARRELVGYRGRLGALRAYAKRCTSSHSFPRARHSP